MREYRTFSEFYPFYLSEHTNLDNRRMHFLGSWCALVALALALVFQNAWLILAGVVLVYGCAWFGHFRFEKNTPATFKYPLYSALGDWVMFKDILIGRISIRD